MHESNAQSRERGASVAGQVSAELILCQQQLAGIGVISTEPCRIEADDVNGELPARELYSRAGSKAVRYQVRAFQSLSDPGAVA